MNAPQTRNRKGRVHTAPHPDCKACELERINAERRAVAAGALRLEIMDYRDILSQVDPAWLLAYDLRRRDTRDHMATPSCTHGRALSAPCRRCAGTPEEEEEV
jgi:hypothetical protein